MSFNYEFRLESIGGLGANLMGKLLGELGDVMGYEAQSFASYGSEKRGSPVKAFIRYSDEPILINYPVREPNLLAIMNMALCNSFNVTGGEVRVPPLLLILIFLTMPLGIVFSSMRVHFGQWMHWAWLLRLALGLIWLCWALLPEQATLYHWIP